MATLDEDPVKKSLLRSIIKGNANKVAEILKNNAKLSADETLDSAQNRLLHKAARYGQNKVVKTLIEVCGANPNAKNKFDMTPLHHAAVEGSSEVIETLINAGADANFADSSKRLPLHWTCANGFLEASRILIQNGKSKVKALDKEGFSPVHRCCQEPPLPSKKPEKPSTAFDDNDVEANKEEELTPEQKAEIDKHRSEIINLLIAKGADVNVREPQGQQTPLHLAAINGYALVCKNLLEAGADVNSVNKISKTPLIYAASEDHLECLKVLSNAKDVDLNKIDVIHNDWNAFHYAILQDNVAALEILLAAGADGQQTDGIGRGPTVIAGDHYKQKALAFLESR